jgi:predicted Zn-dependent protease
VGSVAHLSLAFIDLQEKRYDRVLVATGTFLERYPENVVARMLLGETLLRAGRYREALGEFERVLAADPTLTKCHLFVGLVYAREGRDKAAGERSLRRYLEEEPRAPAHWRRQAVKALEDLRKGIRPSVTWNFAFTGADQMVG